MMQNEKTKILIVDDIPANLLALETALAPLGLEFLRASSGSEAIGQLLRNTGIALILLDVQMPEMDGFETAELIRQDQESCHIPIIFVTAISTDEQYIFKGYRSGAVDYLFKPLDDEVLLSKVKIFVQLHQQRIKTEKALQEMSRAQKSRSLLLDNAGEGIIGIDLELNINFANPAACKLLQLSQDHLIGTNLKKYAEPELSDNDWQQSEFVKVAVSKERQYIEDCSFTNASGECFHVELTQVSIVEDSTIIGGVILFRDITERVESQKKLLQLAQFDFLTGLANRSLFWNFLSKAIANGKRHCEQFALLYIDLDRFKQVNDTHGHLAGDLLLTKTAERIIEALREEDFVARLGGDEFAVIATHVSCPEIAGELANRIVGVLEQSFDILDQEVFIGASIGIALFPEHGDEIKTLTSNADTAMYTAKNKGRNNFQFFNHDMQQAAEKHLELTKEICVAISSNEIQPHCEVIIDLNRSNTSPNIDDIVGFVFSPQWLGHSTIDASSLINLAESSKCLQSLRESLLTALKEKILPLPEYYPADTPIHLSLHLSSHQIQAKYLNSVLAPVLKSFDIDCSRFHIEVDEASVLGNPNSALAELQLFAAKGFNICLSHFASSTTSLQLLSTLPISSIKLGESLVQGIGDEDIDNTIQLITLLATHLKLDIFACGIHSKQQASFLADAGCTKAHGAYYAALSARINASLTGDTPNL